MAPKIVGALTNIVANILLNKPLDPMKAAEAAIKADPVLVNQTNSEPPYQSRVVVGASTGFLGSLGLVIGQVAANPFPNYDWNVMGPALMVVLGSAYALYGRLRNGLAPLFHKKKAA